MSKVGLTEAQLKDAARLKAIYEAKKIEARNKGKKISQETIAADCGWTQGAVGHFLNFLSHLCGEEVHCRTR